MPSPDNAEFGPQDWNLIVAGLSEVAWQYEDVDATTAEWAWELIDVIAADQGRAPPEMLRDLDATEREQSLEAVSGR